MKIKDVLVEDTARKPVIIFGNRNQVILFNAELVGQLSDGYWENASPHDHWKEICHAEAWHSGDPSKWGVYGFRPRRTYSFGNKGLVDIVGERMIWYVKFFNTFPSVPLTANHDIDALNPKGEDTYDAYILSPRYNTSDKYWSDKKARVMKYVGAKNDEELAAAIDKINKFPYSRSELLKDLRQMSQIVNSARSGNRQWEAA